MRRLRLLFTIVPLLLVAASPVLAKPLVNWDLSLDRDVLPSGQRGTAVIRVALDVPEIPREFTRPPVNLTLVLDRSGSMSGDKIRKARDAAVTALRMLGPQDLFSMVIYDHQVHTLVPPQSAANSEWIEAQIQRIRPGGNTALFGAVSQGAAEIRKNLDSRYVHRVVLLSDGLANVGPSSPQDLARLGTALMKEGISVTTVGIGTHYNEDLMAQLAEHSDGNHYFVESSVDLPRIFAAELGDVLSVVARRINIEITTPEGVQPLRIIGREGTIRDNRARIHLNQLYSGQQKYALIEVDAPARVSGHQQILANVVCSYENALTQKQEQLSGKTQVSYSARNEDVIRSANKPVVEAVVENEIAESRDKALDLYNAGRKEEAIRELKASSGKLSQKSQALGFSDIAEDAKELEADAEEFAAPALPSAAKKLLRSKSYNTRKQQKEY